MTRYLISIFLLSSCVSILFGQRTFAPLNAEWKFEFWSNGGGPEGSGQCYGNHKVLRVESEIMIDGKNCGVIQKYSVLHDLEEPFFDGDSIIVWNNDDTVFFYEDGSFYPMYVFKGEIGDTIRTYRSKFSDRFALDHMYTHYDSIDEVSSVIQDVDSIEIDGIIRKRWYTMPVYFGSEEQCRYYGIVVEGIGSMKGMHGMGCIINACGCFGYFICYTDTAIHYEQLECEFLTSVKDIIKSSDIKIYPNPFTDVLYVNNKSEYNFTSLSVRNMNGQMLFDDSYQESVYLNNLVPGVYLVELRTAEGYRYIEKVLRF